MSELDKREATFVTEYLVDLDPKRSALAAGYSASMAATKAYQWVSNSKVKPHVYEAIRTAMAARAERTEITQDMVLREFWAIARADPNELIEYRRGCCRHCYGEGHRYQYTAGEMAKRREAHDKKSDLGAEAEVWDADGLFDEGGGIGFDARREPNTDCPECFGQGVGEVFAKDTRKLSPDAAKLYAGVKITKDGLEIKMHDKAGALLQVGRHLGMFTDKSEVNLAGAVAITKVDPEELRQAVRDVRDEF